MMAAWGKGGVGGHPPGLKHNIHIHYLEVKGDDAPWQLVMFVHLTRFMLSTFAIGMLSM